MEMTELRRVKFTTFAPSVECPDFPSIRESAEEILGYTRPTGIRIGPLADELAEALAKLEIEILDWRDVRTYQLEMKHKTELKVLAKENADDAPPRWETTVQWSETEITKYKGLVPDHALQKAIEIKRELPNVGVYIETLNESRDPFLFVALKETYGHGRSYYIEVWDEPGFEGR